MIQALRMFLLTTLLTGVLYPLLITGIAQVLMQQKADGNFINVKDKIIGSQNIGQNFTEEKYFWPRPSFHDFNPLQSGGSNFGPTSKALKKAVEEREQNILKVHQVDKKSIPAELLFASGSGLDPHISVSTAYFQVERIARARKKETSAIKNLIDQRSERPLFSLKEPIVNVLLLNKALDEVFHDN